IDRMNINRIDFDKLSSATMPKVLESIDIAAASNGWLVLAIHPQYPEYNSDAGYMERREEFRSTLEYAISKGFEILNMRDALVERDNIYNLGNPTLDNNSFAIGFDHSESGYYFDNRR